MQYLINKLKEPWSIYRWLRLGLGIYFLYEAVNREHLLAGAFGALMLIQAANSKPNAASNTDDITYEEVK
jgi:hypothetical protein